jgi:hypothetical protein
MVDGTIGYLAVHLVINFVAHQDERKRVWIPGLRLVEKLVSPLINGVEGGPTGIPTKMCYSCVFRRRTPGLGAHAQTHLSVVSNTSTQQSAPRKNAVPRLWNRSCPAVSQICPHNAIAINDVCQCVCAGGHQFTGHRMTVRFVHLHRHPRLVDHCLFHHEVRADRCLVCIEELLVDVLVKE